MGGMANHMLYVLIRCCCKIKAASRPLFSVFHLSVKQSGSSVMAWDFLTYPRVPLLILVSFPPLTANVKACGFVVYQNNKLFQSKTFISKSDFSQKIESSKTDENVED